MAWKIFGRGRGAATDAATLVTGRAGVKNVQAKGSSGMSANAVTSSRILTHSYDREEALGRQIETKSKEAQRHIAAYNRALAKSALGQRVEDAKRDLRRYSQNVAAVVSVFQDNKYIFDSLQNYLGQKAAATNAKDEISKLIAAMEEALNKLIATTLSGESYDVIRNQKILVLEQEQINSVANLHSTDRNSAIQQFRAQIEMLKQSLNSRMITDSWYNSIIRDLASNFNKLLANLVIVARLARQDYAVDTRIFSRMNSELSVVIEDYFKNWEAISALVDMQRTIHGKIHDMGIIAGLGDQTKRSLLQETEKHTTRIAQSIAKLKSS